VLQFFSLPTCHLMLADRLLLFAGQWIH